MHESKIDDGSVAPEAPAVVNKKNGKNQIDPMRATKSKYKDKKCRLGFMSLFKLRPKEHVAIVIYIQSILKHKVHVQQENDNKPASESCQKMFKCVCYPQLIAAVGRATNNLQIFIN